MRFIVLVFVQTKVHQERKIVAKLKLAITLRKKSQTFRFDDEHPNKVLDVCYSNNYVVVNPILPWKESDVYEYLELRGLTIDNINPLYKKGYKRVGCIGCPMSSKAEEELNSYPKFKAMWLRTCDKIVAKSVKTPFSTGAELFGWWMSDLSAEEYLIKTRNMTKNDQKQCAIMLCSQVE